jgi:hypothetical protein
MLETAFFCALFSYFLKGAKPPAALFAAQIRAYPRPGLRPRPHWGSAPKHAKEARVAKEFGLLNKVLELAETLKSFK